MNKERIQALIKANRESKHELEMGAYMLTDQSYPGCGTACCVIGNYALRTDLQDAFELRNCPDEVMGLYIKDGDETNFWSEAVCNHFGISMSQSSLLFSMGEDMGVYGVCDTPQQAADWIEEWMETQA